jgi:plasmid stability protein
MAQVIVRNLDEEVVSSLKFKAKLHGHSLEQELREILKRAAELTTEEKLALVDGIRAKQKRRLEDDSTDLIREDRDTR